jgi:citrate lyase subunit beta/citryl-CoA lyase
MTPRTYLFVPGDRPDRYGKALAAGADAVIIDLEDAVADEAKPAARTALVQWAEAQRAQAAAVFVRINAASTVAFHKDLAALSRAGIAGVVLSKAEGATDVAAVGEALPGSRVIALIESARGIAALDAICAAPGVERLGFGALDYANDLGLEGDDERGLIEPCSRMAIASRVAGIASPVAGVTTALDDADRLRADLAFARAFGFGAKLCIHPRQLAVVHEAFRPSEADIAWARRVETAVADGTGAVQVDGRMVDRPVILKARDILERAQR